MMLEYKKLFDDLSENFELVERYADEHIKNQYELTLKAIEKQIPMKPNIEKRQFFGRVDDMCSNIAKYSWYEDRVFACPKCGCTTQIQRFFEPYESYCEECGQRISWEEVE